MNNTKYEYNRCTQTQIIREIFGRADDLRKRNLDFRSGTNDCCTDKSLGSEKPGLREKNLEGTTSKWLALFALNLFYRTNLLTSFYFGTVRITSTVRARLIL